MSVDSEILAAIEEIYAAAVDESRWPKVMQDILTLTDSVAATFCALDGADEPRFSTFITVNFEKAFIDEYIQGMMAHDPTVRHIIAHPHQRLVHDSQFITEREKDRHPYYDWHHSFSDTRHRLAGMASVGDKLSSGITVHRTRQQGDYQSRHIQRFELLLPHLERAVNLASRLGTFGAIQQMTFHLLDANPLGIIVLDERSRVVFANRTARAFTAAQDGLALSTKSLCLRSQRDNGKLQNLIGRALSLSHGEETRPVGTMKAHRPSGKRPLSILVAPLCRAPFILTWARPAVCVVIADPEREDELPDEVLRTIYGLTPAEARLAIKIASGTSLQHAADELTISYRTARTQLATIFRKTSTCRQGELVKLLLSELRAI